MKPQEIVDRFVHLARTRADEERDAGAQGALLRLERSLAASRNRQRVPVTARRFAFAAAAAAVLTAGTLLADRHRPLTFEVTRGGSGEHGYIVSKGARAVVRFSDRSELSLEPGARLRVANVDAHGAHVVLEGGTMHVSVSHRPQARWAIDAGPFVVRVTGTEFDVAWFGDSQTLDVRLRKGSVTVEGPLADGTFAMTSGQHLIAKAADKSLTVTDERAERAPPPLAAATDPRGGVGGPEAPSDPGAANAPSPPGAVAGRPASAPSVAARGEIPPGSRVGPAEGWAGLVARGEYQAVLDDAGREGLDRVLPKASQTELGALADAARYARASDVARRALTTLRSRFATSVRAHDAAFFLGDLAEGAGDGAGALDWYDTYLRESPGGAYTSQALGRTLILARDRRGPAAARAAASEYLERFPDGPYAPNARKVLESR